jgi:hypothetical protein
MVFDAHAYLAMAKVDFFLGKCRQRPADVPMTLKFDCTLMPDYQQYGGDWSFRRQKER